MPREASHRKFDGLSWICHGLSCFFHGLSWFIMVFHRFRAWNVQAQPRDQPRGQPRAPQLKRPEKFKDEWEPWTYWYYIILYHIVIVCCYHEVTTHSHINPFKGCIILSDSQQDTRQDTRSTLAVTLITHRRVSHSSLARLVPSKSQTLPLHSEKKHFENLHPTPPITTSNCQ